MGVGTVIGKLLLKNKKGTVGAIRSIPPNVPKTSIEKATRTVKIATQKMKASMAKIESDVFHKTQELKKKVDKIKIKKPR
jgi:hypothetical protein